MLVQLRDRWASPDAGGRAAATTAARPPRAVGQLLVRPAGIRDMREVEPLIREFANDNLMLPKSFDQLARTFREFVVAESDGRIIGCGALRIYNEGLAEICSLAVDAACQGQGVGRQLVERLVEEARALELTTVFALTLRPEFFGHIGFSVVPKENFPLKVWADCRSCPKLHACDEIAVALDIAPTEAVERRSTEHTTSD